MKATDGYEIQVGDVIEVDTRAFGVRRHSVTRVTKAFAFVRYNEAAEGKFPRVFRSFGFGPKPSLKWDRCGYSVIPAKEDSPHA